jgi:hypothetical protein
MNEHQLTATVSGSFRQAMSAVQDAVYELTDAGARVLSPADPRVVDAFGDFMFVASDRVRAIRLVQDRHLAAIEASDFVWLVAPDGYIGLSGAMEIGHAASVRTPVYSSEVPSDLTLRQYVTTLASPSEALRVVRRRRTASRRVSAADANVLLEPLVAVEAAHHDLDVIAGELTRAGQRSTSAATTSARRLERGIARPLRADR